MPDLRRWLVPFERREWSCLRPRFSWASIKASWGAAWLGFGLALLASGVLAQVDTSGQQRAVTPTVEESRSGVRALRRGAPRVGPLRTGRDALVAVPVVGNDLQIGSSTLTYAVAPGDPISFSFTVTNPSAERALGVSVTNDLSGSVADLFCSSGSCDVSWTCTATNGAVCRQPSVVGTLSAIVDLPGGSSAVTFDGTATVGQAPPGSYQLITDIAPGSRYADPDLANNRLVQTIVVARGRADLSVAPSLARVSGGPGDVITLPTIEVSNLGPSHVPDARVVNDFLRSSVPQLFSDLTWTCSASAESQCPATGAGDIDAQVELERGGWVRFDVTATLGTALAHTYPLTTTATLVSNLLDPDLSNNSGTIELALGSPEADLSVSPKTAQSSAKNGDQVTLPPIVVRNGGPDAADGATVVSSLLSSVPQPFSDSTWTCTATGGATCPASGSNVIPTLPPSSEVRFVVTGTVDGAPGTYALDSSVVAPAGTMDPDLSNNSGTIELTLGFPVADLGVGPKTAQISATDGDRVTLPPIVVRNGGPDAADGARVVSSLLSSVPQPFSDSTWTCSATGGATCPASGSTLIPSLPPSGEVRFVVTGTVSGAPGTYALDSSVSVPAGTIDPDFTNNGGTIELTVDPAPAARVELSVGPSWIRVDARAGEVVTLPAIVVANSGPDEARDADVVNDFLASHPGAPFTSVSWVCTASGGASCRASGSGRIEERVTLPPQSAVQFVATVAIGMRVGTYDLDTSVTKPQSAVENDSSDNRARIQLVVTGNRPRADAQLTASLCGSPTTLAAGETLSYCLEVENSGPDDGRAFSLAARLDPRLSTAVWCRVAGGQCAPLLPLRDLSAALFDLDVGQLQQFVVSGELSCGGPGALQSSFVLTGPNDPSSPDTASAPPVAVSSCPPPVSDLSVTATPARVTAREGDLVQLEIEVRNHGAQRVQGVRVDNDFQRSASASPISRTSWCFTTDGSVCAPPAGDLGSLAASVLVEPWGRTRFYVDVVVAGGAWGSHDLETTISPPASFRDSDTTNNSATHRLKVPTAELQLSARATGGGCGQEIPAIDPGKRIIYCFELVNDGPDAGRGFQISADQIDPELVNVQWCQDTSGDCAPTTPLSIVPPAFDLGVGTAAVLVFSGGVPIGKSGSVVSSFTISGGDDPGSPRTVTVSTPVTTVPQQTIFPSAVVRAFASDSSSCSASLVAVAENSPLTYCLEVEDQGSGPGAGYTVETRLDSDVRPVAWCQSASGPCTPPGQNGAPGLISFDLAAGETVRLIVDGELTPGAQGVLTTELVVRGPLQDLGMPAKAVVRTIVTGGGDLQISPVSFPKTVIHQDETLEYAFAVLNPGGTDAQGIGVENSFGTDRSPGPFCSGGVCDVTWTCTEVGSATCPPTPQMGPMAISTLDVPAGGAAIFDVRARVGSAVALGEYGMRTEMMPLSSFPDSNRGNNTLEQTLEVVRTARLQESVIVTEGTCPANVSSDDNVDTIDPGSSIAYCIDLRNDGPNWGDFRISEALDDEIVGAGWCQTAPGATCLPTEPLAGLDRHPFRLDPKQEIRFVVSGKVGTEALCQVESSFELSGDDDPRNDRRLARKTSLRTAVDSCDPAPSAGLQLTDLELVPRAELRHSAEELAALGEAKEVVVAGDEGLVYRAVVLNERDTNVESLSLTFRVQGGFEVTMPARIDGPGSCVFGEVSPVSEPRLVRRGAERDTADPVTFATSLRCTLTGLAAKEGRTIEIEGRLSPSFSGDSLHARFELSDSAGGDQTLVAPLRNTVLGRLRLLPEDPRLPQATAGVFYAPPGTRGARPLVFTAEGGFGRKRLTLGAGTMVPEGMELVAEPAQAGSSTFALSGTPITQKGEQAEIVFDVEDQDGRFVQKAYRLDVQQQLLFSITPPMANALSGREFEAPLIVRTSSGRQVPESCELVFGAIPKGFEKPDGCVLRAKRGAELSQDLLEFKINVTARNGLVATYESQLQVVANVPARFPSGFPREPRVIDLGMEGQSLQGLATDAYGGRYVVGSVPTNGGSDLRLERIDPTDRSDRARNWSREVGTDWRERGFGVAVSPSQQIFVAGLSEKGSAFQGLLARFEVDGFRPSNSEVRLGPLDALYGVVADKWGVYAVGERYDGTDFDALIVGYEHNLVDRLWDPIVLDTDTTDTAYAVVLLPTKNRATREMLVAGARGPDQDRGWFARFNGHTGVVTGGPSELPAPMYAAAVDRVSPDTYYVGGGDEASGWRIFEIDETMRAEPFAEVAAGSVLRTLAVDFGGFVYAGGRRRGGDDGLIAVFSRDGTSFTKQLSFGGGGRQRIHGIAVDTMGRVIVGAETEQNQRVQPVVLQVDTGKEVEPK